jgi:2-polyprenyl-6-methoxyphenol hydroxylase-like FAD-dependent oxidoreductase
VPLRHDYDVAVIGAGPAGVAAAAGAAETGKNILLVDASDRLGGAVTAAMHRSLCGLYAGAPQSPLDTLNAGTQRNIVELMLRKEPQLVQPRRFGKAWVLEFPASAWLAALADVCSKPNIDLKLNSRVTAVRRAGARITAIQIDDWIEIKAVVDCTGGGNVLQLAGDDTLLPPDPTGPMLGGYSIRFTNLTGEPEMLRLQTAYALTQATEAGTLPPLARFTAFYPGPGDGEGVCKLAVNPDEFSTEQVKQFADGVIEHLRREVPAFHDAKIVEQSPRAQRRDGRRLRGKFIVTEDDILSGRKVGPDAVHAWWPIERWDISHGPTYTYPPPDEHYDIPLDALRSAEVENLFAGGICVSATPGAAASIRAGGICLATGDAAGRLANEMGYSR